MPIQSQSFVLIVHPESGGYGITEYAAIREHVRLLSDILGDTGRVSAVFEDLDAREFDLVHGLWVRHLPADQLAKDPVYKQWAVAYEAALTTYHDLKGVSADWSA